MTDETPTDDPHPAEKREREIDWPAPEEEDANRSDELCESVPWSHLSTLPAMRRRGVPPRVGQRPGPSRGRAALLSTVGDCAERIQNG